MITHNLDFSGFATKRIYRAGSKLTTKKIWLDHKTEILLTLNDAIWDGFEYLSEKIGFPLYLLFTDTWEEETDPNSPTRVEDFIDSLIGFTARQMEEDLQAEYGYANDNLYNMPCLFKHPEWMRYSTLKRENLRG
ncbi:hypothetical protein [Labrenzia sp. PHM005]|uniref:hypothetical protein n=1 Tax=Labrenzia sp. PHM005 TaxID=2590016 RepID=UPI0011404D73|nr:hypothetical protein [Labrenzia sp. PHM005]QDG74385.1 hypothetical protein FJ695_00020 [Labrenzia sp. PHM005]